MISRFRLSAITTASSILKFVSLRAGAGATNGALAVGLIEPDSDLLALLSGLPGIVGLGALCADAICTDAAIAAANTID